MAVGQLKGQLTGNFVIDFILSGYSVRNYSTETVTDQFHFNQFRYNLNFLRDLTLILTKFKLHKELSIL